VVINPNNPTGALYSTKCCNAIVDIAREHGLVIFADEVYDKVLYDGVKHTPIASLSQDVLTLDLQLVVQELPVLRLSCRLAGGVWR
jgi:alanine-synthesizing transaminase